MAKKPIESKHELVKFIKNLYTEEVQLNFDESFTVSPITGSNLLKLSFPKNSYYFLEGTIDMSECTTFYNWLVHSETPSSVTINNNELDDMRKEKLSDFENLTMTDTGYKVSVLNRDYVFEKVQKTDNSDYNFDFKFKTEIPNSLLDESVLTIYFKESTGEFAFSNFEGAEVLFDCAVKNIKVLFKKGGKYKIYTTTKDDNGFRTVMIEGKGQLCTLKQYFKVI